ncbi:unnamed protein product, partial [Polarella glacialis]
AQRLAFGAAGRIAAAARRGNLEEALAIFYEANSPSEASCSAAVAACGRARSWQRGLELLEDFLCAQRPGTVLGPVVHNAGIGAAAAGGAWQHALHLFWRASHQDA